MTFPDRQEIERSLNLLFQPDETVELRCVGNGPTVNGFYRDFDKLANDACTLNADFSPMQNTHICLNPVKPELYGRRANQFGRAGKGEGVEDVDVVCRRWLLIDIDVVRPQGVSATESQKRAAEMTAKAVYDYLVNELRLPAPVCADSGNGCHMLLRLPDLSVTDQANWICKQFLKWLAERFNDNQTKVDVTTFNAARICKLYGTVARKGSDIPEQPHRLAKLVHLPDPIVPVSLEALAKVTGVYPGRQQVDPAQADDRDDDRWDVDRLLQDRDAEYSKNENYRTNSGEQATAWELEICPWDPDHNDRSAWIIQWRSGAIAAGCQHNGCAGNDWSKLKEAWGLPTTTTSVTAADIILPSRVMTPMEAALDSFIEPPAIPTKAFYGPLGEIVLGVAEDTEASPIAVLACALMYFGSAVGRRYYVQLDQWHFPKLYVALVGPTSTGRKGTADWQAQRIIDAIDPMAELYRQGGLSTGEGLLEILDANREGMYPRPAVFTESEFATVLKRTERRGNTLSGYVRSAWDDSPLANSNKSNPVRIVDHHVSLCVHITASELLSLLNDVSIGNGFANKFAWIYTARPKLKPGAAGFRADRFPRQLAHLQAAMEALKQEHAQADGPIKLPLTDEAWRVWCEHLYADLDVNADEDTAMTLMGSRQPQQVCRIASIFALADGRRDIDVEHLYAARAVADYAWESVDYILSRPWWGDSSNPGDPAGMKTKVLEALKDGPKSRTYISSTVLRRNRTAKELNALRDLMIQDREIRVDQQSRPETWSLL